LKALSGRELARLVERRGWRLLRVSGRHRIDGNIGSAVRRDSRSRQPHSQDRPAASPGEAGDISELLVGDDENVDPLPPKRSLDFAQEQEGVAS
jgi:hypothetical protein